MKSLLFACCCCFIVLSCKDNSGNLPETGEQELTSSKTKSTSKNFQLLQGKWQNLEDPKSIILFDGNLKIETYEGSNKISGIEFQLSDKCLTSFKAVGVLKSDRYISLMDANQCFYIVNLTKDTLQLSDVGQENNIIYKKVE